MSTLQTEYIFNGSVARVFAGICRYEDYGKYLPGVTKIEMLPASDPKAVCQVRYEINLVKKFYYTLEMYQDKPHKIWWSLVESNLMKSNEGSWEFKAQGKDKTKGIYAVEVKFKGLIPSALTDQIAKANLPLLMAGFQKMVDDAPTS